MGAGIYYGTRCLKTAPKVLFMEQWDRFKTHTYTHTHMYPFSCPYTYLFLIRRRSRMRKVYIKHPPFSFKDILEGQKLCLSSELKWESRTALFLWALHPFQLSPERAGQNLKESSIKKFSEPNFGFCWESVIGSSDVHLNLNKLPPMKEVGETGIGI